MDKTQTLESIQNARNAHKLQMVKIEAVLNYQEVEDPTAVSKTMCAFGQWLYAEENRVQEILGAQFYDNIETLHAKWHSEYIRIFEIFFKDNKKKGFFSKILGTPKVDGMEMDKAKLYYSELQTTTNNLLKALDSSQRRVLALPESKFR